MRTASLILLLILYLAFKKFIFVRKNPMRILVRVVFLAPLSPSRPKILPLLIKEGLSHSFNLDLNGTRVPVLHTGMQVERMRIISYPLPLSR